jgi:hypothetical protein
MVYQKFRHFCAQFIPDPNGKYEHGEINGDRIEIFYGGRYRNYWKLPDGSVSIISTRPAENYCFRHGRFKPGGRFTVEGVFPFFQIVQTKQPVWLNADRTLTLTPVDFIEQANLWYRLDTVMTKR